MRLHKIFLMTVVGAMMISSCKDQLDVQTNEPQVTALSSENDLLAFATGGVYRNGFVDLKYTDGVMGAFWSTGYHDLMGDVVSAEAANVYINQLGSPELVSFADGTPSIANPGNPTHQPALIRQANKNSNASQNPSFYEWAYMYALNNVANNIIVLSDQVTYSGNAEVKAKTLKAWAYWWKGFAYFRIGSMYYAGVISDEPNALTGTGEYHSSAAILAEAEKNLAACEALLGTLGGADYETTLKRLIPDYFQTGHGGVLTPEMWVRNINTLRARMLLANTREDAMTPANWQTILDLTAEGIVEDDFVFTLRANATADIFSGNSGFTSSKTTGDPRTGATYKITERLIQDFQPNDARFFVNFDTVETVVEEDGEDVEKPSPWIGESSRGNAFNTRWELVDGGYKEGEDSVFLTPPLLTPRWILVTDLGDSLGTYVYSDREPSSSTATEQYVAGSWEENHLMRAEALINTGDIAGGVALIDQVRVGQGAGLPAISPLISEADALEQLRSERRVGLLFRWVSFYDARRWGVLDPVAQGGGRTNAVVLTKDGVLHTDATLDFQYLDYWDVPDNEIVYNPPVGGAPTTNPKN